MKLMCGQLVALCKYGVSDEQKLQLFLKRMETFL
jgi:hypothetical protein